MMKKIFAGILWLLLLPCLAAAADLNFQWDLVPGQTWDNVRLYEIMPDNSYVMVSEVAGTATMTTLQNVSIGLHIYIARAYQSGSESPDSNQAPWEIKPSSPQNFRIIAVYIAEDGTVTFRLVDPAEFFRS